MNRITVDNILGEAHLIVYLNEAEYSYEEQMIRKLNNSNILKCRIDYQDGKKRLCYNISGLMPLDRYLELNPLKLEDMMKYIVQLKNSIVYLERFMLDAENIYLGFDGLYADKETGMMKLCIVPGNRWNIYKSEFTELLLRYVYTEDTEALKFAFKIFKASLEEDFEIKKLFLLLEEKNTFKHPENQSLIKNEAIENIQEPMPVSYIEAKEKIVLAEAEEFKEGRNEINAPKNLKSGLKALKIKKPEKILQENDKSSLAVRILVSIAVLSVLVFILVMLKGRAVLKRIIVPYFVLSAAVTIYHMLGYFFEKIKRPKAEKEREINNSGDDCCRLIPKDMQDDIIEILYFPFIIGSREGITDYTLTGRDIEPVHLRLEDTEDGILFTDMNTDRGTVIGDIKISKGQSRIAKSGAEIVIGEHKYILQK